MQDDVFWEHFTVEQHIVVQCLLRDRYYENIDYDEQGNEIGLVKGKQIA